MDLEEIILLYKPIENGRLQHLKDNWFHYDPKTGFLYMYHMQRPVKDSSGQRHKKPAKISCAVSTDGIHWNNMGTAIEPSQCKFGLLYLRDATLATGSTFEKDGKFYVAYTQRPTPGPADQSIAMAASNNFMDLNKCHNPVFELDDVLIEKDYDTGHEKRYKNGLCGGKVHACRDPFIFQDSNDKEHVYMAFTTRDKKWGDAQFQAGNPDHIYNGCIGLLKIKLEDLTEIPEETLTWKPKWERAGKLNISDQYKGRHIEMEVPQVIFHDDKVYAFFGGWEEGNKENHGNVVPGGLFCYVSENGLYGEFKPVNIKTDDTGKVINDSGQVLSMEDTKEDPYFRGKVLEQGEDGRFSSRLVKGAEVFGTRLIPELRGDERWDLGENEYLAIGWLRGDDQGNTLNACSKPFKVRIDGEKVAYGYL